jgi:hypothetical protein
VISYLSLKWKQMLSFSNAMGEFDPRESHRSRRKGLESQHRGTPLFDGSMVLLNHAVEIPARAPFHLPPTVIFVSQQSQTSKGCLVPIDVDLGRPWDPPMGDNDLTLGHRRGQITVAQPIRDVPADTELYSFRRMVAPAINRVALDGPGHARVLSMGDTNTK